MSDYKRIPFGPLEYVVAWDLAFPNESSSTMPMSAQELTKFFEAVPKGKEYEVQTIQPYKLVREI